MFSPLLASLPVQCTYTLVHHFTYVTIFSPIDSPLPPAFPSLVLVFWVIFLILKIKIKTIKNISLEQLFKSLS